MMKLISLSDFVGHLADEPKGGFARERYFNDLVRYNQFLNTKLTLSMFQGEKPLFSGFVQATQAEAFQNKIKKSFDFYKDGFSFTIYGKYQGKNTYITSYNIETIADLVGKIDEEFDEFHPEFGWKN